MVFIVQPEKEGETKTCENCGSEVTGRLTDYKGRFPDKLQWQDVNERKAHYDKNGNCKTQTPPNEIELKPTDKNQTSLEQPNTLAATDRDILQTILHIVSDIKTQGVKIRDD